jgi:hypothetical protein
VHRLIGQFFSRGSLAIASKIIRPLLGKSVEGSFFSKEISIFRSPPTILPINQKKSLRSVVQKYTTTCVIQISLGTTLNYTPSKASSCVNFTNLPWYTHLDLKIVHKGKVMVFVKARGGPPNVGDPPSQFTVQYFDEEGNMTIRSDGKRAWRCNNLA